MSETLTLCPLCNDPVYGVLVHPCCEFWASRGDGHCVACAESRKARRGRKARR